MHQLIPDGCNRGGDFLDRERGQSFGFGSSIAALLINILLEAIVFGLMVLIPTLGCSLLSGLTPDVNLT